MLYIQAKASHRTSLLEEGCGWERSIMASHFILSVENAVYWIYGMSSFNTSQSALQAECYEDGPTIFLQVTSDRCTQLRHS